MRKYRKFNNTLENLQPDVEKNDFRVIVASWNAKIGSNNMGFKNVMGECRIVERNESGE
jgi:hypothetical protein